VAGISLILESFSNKVTIGSGKVIAVAGGDCSKALLFL